MIENEDKQEIVVRVDPLSPAPVKKSDALPTVERVFAAPTLVDPLPAPLLETLGGLELTDEQNAILTAPVPDDEFDILPDKGLVYVRHEYIRQRLNQAFKPAGWTMIEVSPFCRGPGNRGGDEWYQKWALVVKKTLVGVAMSSATYNESNKNDNLSNTWETIQSDCLKRIAGKQLGVGLEAWNPRRARQIRDTYCVKVDAIEKGEKKEKWRRKDSEPLAGEGDVAAQCPSCKHNLMRSKFGEGWYCNKKAGGCGKNFTDAQLGIGVEPPKPVEAPKPVKLKPDPAPAANGVSHDEPLHESPVSPTLEGSKAVVGSSQPEVHDTASEPAATTHQRSNQKGLLTPEVTASSDGSPAKVSCIAPQLQSVLKTIIRGAPQSAADWIMVLTEQGIEYVVNDENTDEVNLELMLKTIPFAKFGAIKNAMLEAKKVAN